VSKRNTTGALEDAILAGDAPLASSRAADARLARQLRGDVDAILAKAMKREPSARYPTADALAADIQRYLQGHVIEARPDSAWYRLRKAIVRHRVPVAGVSAVLLVALAGATATLIQGRRAAAEAERTQLATAFVSELFQVSAAYDNSKDQSRLTPEARIERGAQLIEARFEKQPEMKAEMYGTVARVYVDLGVTRLASEYASRQLQTLQQQKADGERIARAQMLKAEAALAAHRHKDAEEYTRAALQSLPHDSSRVPDVLALLARVQLLNGKTAEAKQTVAEGRRLLAGRRADDSVALSWLLFVEAELLRIEGKHQDTDALVYQAIEHAMKIEGPLSRTAIEMRLHQTNVLIFDLRLDEGRRMHDAALAALRRLGGVHDLRAALATTELQVMLSQNGFVPFPETVAVLKEVRATLDAHAAPVPAEVRAAVDYDYGAALIETGDIGAGVPLLLRSAEVLADWQQQDLFQQYCVAYWSGYAYLLAGDQVAAERAFRRSLHAVEEWGHGQGSGANLVWMYIARSVTMQGRPQEAEAFLSTAPEFAADAHTSPQPKNLVAYERAYARLVAGDAAGASKLLPRDDPNPYGRGWWSRFVELRGEILCAAGDRSAGLELLQRAMADYLALGMVNPDLAYTRGIAGLCALELGERRQAEEWATLARSYFEAQPGVGTYFKKPLAELEKRLGERQPSRAGSRRATPLVRAQRQ
jgi:TolA-binding protein